MVYGLFHIGHHETRRTDSAAPLCRCDQRRKPVCLTMHTLDHSFTDPRWGGYQQIQEAGGHVRKEEKGTPRA